MDLRSQKERRNKTSLKRTGDHRNDFERDLARLIHSAAFRRLQAKTQVLGIGEGDFHRTRLTHSMEVAQIGRGLVRNLKARPRIPAKQQKNLPDEDLIFFAGLAHDLGHPPFGHGGEIALNYSMRQHGGFEGNAQTLRLLSKLEAHTPNCGLNLTRRSLLSILKYPVKYSQLRCTKLPKSVNRVNVKGSDWKPPKCFYDDECGVVEWILSPIQNDDLQRFIGFAPPTNSKNGKSKEMSFDATIMDLADDIAYGVHDLEDAIALRLITRDMWDELKVKLDGNWLKTNNLLKLGYQLFGDSWQRKRAVGGLVGAFMVNAHIIEREYVDPLLCYGVKLSEEAQQALRELKKTVYDKVIEIPEVQTLEYRGQQIIMQIYDAIASDPARLLKDNFKFIWEKATKGTEKLRTICDYISGMTDEYAIRLYERLFVPRQGTIFQRL